MVHLVFTPLNNSGWIVITTGWALAVYVAVVVAGPYSGAHINPAVSIGLAVAGKFPWEDIPLYVLGQMIGAMLGAFMVWLTYRNHFDATEDNGAKKAVFCTAPAIRNMFSNVFSEAIGTFVLIFTILYFTDATINETETVVGLGSLGALPVAFFVVHWFVFRRNNRICHKPCQGFRASDYACLASY